MKRSFALLAVLFLLLRPLCEVQAAGFAHGEPGPHTHATTGYQADEAVPCCAELDDGSLAPLSVPALALGAGDGKLAFAAPVLTAAHYAGTPGTVARHTPGVLLPSLSFYARSARVRR
jgi:hypothetical protein